MIYPKRFKLPTLDKEDKILSKRTAMFFSRSTQIFLNKSGQGLHVSQKSSYAIKKSHRMLYYTIK